MKKFRADNKFLRYLMGEMNIPLTEDRWCKKEFSWIGVSRTTMKNLCSEDESKAQVKQDTFAPIIQGFRKRNKAIEKLAREYYEDWRLLTTEVPFEEKIRKLEEYKRELQTVWEWRATVRQSCLWRKGFQSNCHRCLPLAATPHS